MAARPDECNDIGAIPRADFDDRDTISQVDLDAVDWGVNVGLISDGGDFNPTKAATRGVALTVLHRYMCEPTAGTADFDDVPDNAFYADAVDWAASSGVVSGKSPSEFKEPPMLLTLLWNNMPLMTV